ncbi:hypothetical protein AVEN_116279-1 [Araneus ventricosus]|uniref:Uncharacterized protein n=1 Tax=Araneus ventricosus TaxID=182803 RepID=A0A4Y2PTH4_ARAVE|nr:hypothetical protein AVEN_116279-1 [Araneus ventricosus]
MNEYSAHCIYFLDGSTGKLLHKLRSPTGGILSVNVFNISGDCLASGTGSNIVFWKDKDVFDGPAFQRKDKSKRKIVLQQRSWLTTQRRFQAGFC